MIQPLPPEAEGLIGARVLVSSYRLKGVRWKGVHAVVEGFRGNLVGIYWHGTRRVWVCKVEQDGPRHIRHIPARHVPKVWRVLGRKNKEGE